MTVNPSIAVIIPIFEEQESIERVLTRLQQVLGSNGKVYLVADNESDSTILQVKKFMSKSPLSIDVLIQYPNSGPAKAIVFGIENSVEHFVIFMTADDSDDVEDIPKLVELLNAGFCLVSASRYMKHGRHIGGPVVKHALSRVAGITSKFILRSGTSDPTNLFKGVDRSFLSSIEIESDFGFTIGLELVAKAQLHQSRGVSEIPTIWKERITGESTFRFIRWLPSYLYWYCRLIQYRALSISRSAKVSRGT